jgi:hypothetical protein
MPVFRSPHKNLMLGFQAIDKVRSFTDGVLIVPDGNKGEAELIRSHPSFGLRFTEDIPVAKKTKPVVEEVEVQAEPAEEKSAPTATKRPYNRKPKEGVAQ